MKNATIYFRGFLCLLMVGAVCSRSIAQQEMPTTQPSAATDAQIDGWLNQLADVDPDVRESGVQALMGLTREDLPRLRAIAKAQGPLMPGQSAALQEVVKQVYLSGRPEQTVAGMGLLGLHWPATSEQSNTEGLPVVDRIAGFPAYRMLREGDLITEVVNRPNIDVHLIPSFIASVSELGPGDDLLLRVQRGGRSILIPLRLMPRPVEANDEGSSTQWRTQREAEESDYWTTKFADLDTSSTVPSTQP